MQWNDVKVPQFEDRVFGNTNRPVCPIFWIDITWKSL